MSDRPITSWIANYLVPAAIGAAAIVWAAFAIYRRQERTRRYLARPLVAVQWNFQPNQGPFTRWVIDLRNEAAEPVNIESMTVVASGEIVEWEGPMEPPADYWSRVLYHAGILKIHQIEGNVVHAPRSISGKSNLLLFDAYVGGQPDNISKAIKAIEIRLHCRSAAGESSALSHRYGSVKPL